MVNDTDEISGWRQILHPKVLVLAAFLAFLHFRLGYMLRGVDFYFPKEASLGGPSEVTGLFYGLILDIWWFPVNLIQNYLGQTIFLLDVTDSILIGFATSYAIQNYQTTKTIGAMNLIAKVLMILIIGLLAWSGIRFYMLYQTI